MNTHSVMTPSSGIVATAGRMALALALLALPASAWAQASSGRASSIVIPVAAKTGSFETEVFVRNPSNAAGPIDIDVLYYEANGLASPGLVNCGFLTIPVNANDHFKLGECTPLATGSHFGMLILRDRAAQKVNSFSAYSRVQHVTTNQGFSIEGFPEHTFSGRASSVIGLKREAAAVPATQAQPGYLPNCFVGSLGEPVDYVIRLFNEDGTVQMGPSILGHLEPYQLIRYLDVLTAAGVTTGDRDHFRASFDNVTAVQEGPAYLAFCTEQDNLSFGADFRIAKSDDEANITKLLLRCRGTSDAACATLTAPATYSIPNATTKHRFSMFIHHPDYVRCDIVGPNAGNLELQLLTPAPSGQPVGLLAAGGNDASTFYYETGPRNAVVNSTGFQTFWTLEVGPREGGGAPAAFPADYGLKCQSGSGIHVSGAKTDVTDDF